MGRCRYRILEMCAVSHISEPALLLDAALDAGTIVLLKNCKALPC